jgi:endo-1,4-beta-xylanase
MEEPAASRCEPAPDPPLDAAQASLAEAYAPFFKVGVAVASRTSSGADPAAAALAAQQYNRATPENALKWQSLEPRPGEFNFAPADAFLAYAEANGMEVHGHALVWHQQVPGWVFEPPAGGTLTRELLLSRLEDHIRALAEHFGTRIRYWDVVNEAINDDGSLRATPWLAGIGPDYIEQAFVLADRYFPDAKLVYNDFSMEQDGKRDAVVALVQGFKARGIRIDALGTQGHVRIQAPTLAAIERSLVAFGDTGVEVLVSELDVDVLPPASQNQGADLSVSAELSARLNPYVECLPADVAEQAAARWASLFGLFAAHSDVVRAVTLWGVADGYSWLNNWPVNGRTNYALLFDRSLQPKPAWQRVIDAASVAQ